ncbi:copper resistance protein B [Azospirillum halopraeferens]|uniref:copper resistance protein B n=1 Tax=Azospirillum halopraeferens TaxID=34010 RepID=UPI00040EAEAF|nr:copper resistance protein B [Azospirillum halopraeferens]
MKIVMIALGLLVLAATPVRAAGPEHAERFHEELPILATLRVERLEHRRYDGANTVDWRLHGWIGDGTNKLWFDSEGHRTTDGDVEEAEVRLLYSRMVSEFWDVQAGVRHDLRPRPQTTYGVLGVRGTAPWFIETSAHAFVAEDGALSARLEAEHDLLITGSLVLQPSVEVNLSSRRVHEREIGRGVTDVELGLRLRYEFAREFAPYVGVVWERKLGQTADLARAHGEDAGNLSFVTGVRFWF